MGDQDETPILEEVSAGERPLAIPPELPVLPLRDTVLFPNSFMPLAVARESSVRLIDEAITDSKLIGVFTQRDAALDEPHQADLYPIGTATHIHKMFRLPDGSLRLIVQGLARIRLDEVVAVRPYLRAPVSAAPDELRDEDRLEIDALQRNIKSNFQKVVSLSPLLSDDLQTLALNIAEPGRLADFIASSLSTIGTPVKQEVLETLDVRARMDTLNRILIKELEVLELGSKIQSQVQSEVGKNQREYFLREQMKAIQKELGEGDDQTKEIEELREKIEAAQMPELVQKEALRELDRLSRMPVAAAEYTVSRTYLDWLVALPWDKRTEETIDLARTKRILDDEHSGLEKAKDRILEYLAVRKLNPDGEGADPLLRRASRRRQDVAGQVDCDVARPQVRARLARRHARRGRDPRPPPHVHRRAARAGHPGAAARGVEEPGVHPRRDRQARVRLPRRSRARRCSRCSTPSRTTRSATTTSTCRSICRRCCSSRRRTCSTRSRRALRDRMEVLELPGYTEEEKLKIAREHLVAKQVANHGLTGEQITFTDAALRAVIRGYTREAGVRNLEREIGVDLPEGRAAARRGRRVAARGDARRRRRDARRAAVSRRGDGGAHEAPGRGDRPGLDAGGRRGALHRGLAHGGHGHADAHRLARRRDEGVGAHGALLVPRARRANTASTPTSTGTPRSTSTCRPAPSRRTARRPA